MLLVEGLSTPVSEPDSEENEDEDEDTPTSRFIGRFIRCMLKGFEAKDKTVRYRVLQIIAETLSAMEAVEYVTCILWII